MADCHRPGFQFVDRVAVRPAQDKREFAYVLGTPIIYMRGYKSGTRPTK